MASVAVSSADIVERWRPPDGERSSFSIGGRLQSENVFQAEDDVVQFTGVAFLTQRSEWLLQDYARLAMLAHLTANWDSYGAEAPGPKAIRAARTVLGVLGDIECRPSSIDASVEGGVCLSFSRGQRYGDIECFNSGEIWAVVSTGGGDTDVWIVANGTAAIWDTAEAIRRYVGC